MTISRYITHRYTYTMYNCYSIYDTLSRYIVTIVNNGNRVVKHDS